MLPLPWWVREFWPKVSSLTSLDHLGRTTYFDRCDLSHNKMEEFKGKETASFGKEFQNFFIIYF